MRRYIVAFILAAVAQYSVAQELGQNSAPPSAPAPAAASAPLLSESARQVAQSRLGACVAEPPEYPSKALRQELTGLSLVAFTVTPEGSIEKPGLLRSSGHVILDRAAFAHLTSCIAAFSAAEHPKLPAGSYSLPIQWLIE